MMKKQVKRDAHIFLPEDSDRLVIGWKDFIYLQYVILLSDDRLSMSQLLDKYFEWRLIAVENKVSDMDKEIGTVDVHFMWKTGDGEMKGGKGSMTLGFLAQTETRHQLYISFPKIEDDHSSRKFDTWYLDEAEVRHLDKCLSPSYIEKKIEEFRKGAATRDLFK